MLLRQQLEEEDKSVGLSLDGMEEGEGGNEQQDEDEEEEEEDRPRQKYEAANLSGHNGTMQFYGIGCFFLHRLSKKQKRKKKQQKVVHVSIIYLNRL